MTQTLCQFIRYIVKEYIWKRKKKSQNHVSHLYIVYIMKI